MTIEVYRWEDDPEGEDVLVLLKERGLGFLDHLLDPEVPSAAPCVIVDGKFGEFSELSQLLG